MLHSLWQYKPVQTAATGLATGSVLVGLMVVYNQFFSVVPGQALTKFLNAYDIEASSSKGLMYKTIDQKDPEFLHLLERLYLFRKFDEEAFDRIVQSIYVSVETKANEYSSSKTFTASASYRIRSNYQKVIEAIRYFRAILEHTMKSALEDFDEIE